MPRYGGKGILAVDAMATPNRIASLSPRPERPNHLDLERHVRHPRCDGDLAEKVPQRHLECVLAGAQLKKCAPSGHRLSHAALTAGQCMCSQTNTLTRRLIRTSVNQTSDLPCERPPLIEAQSPRHRVPSVAAEALRASPRGRHREGTGARSAAKRSEHAEGSPHFFFGGGAGGKSVSSHPNGDPSAA
jgi:hypothetical protein